jgi:hypothetical protein
MSVQEEHWRSCAAVADTQHCPANIDSFKDELIEHRRSFVESRSAHADWG